MNLRRIASGLYLLMFAHGVFAAGPSVNITHVWIRTAPAGVVTLSGYMTLKNLSDAPLKILDITSPDFGAVSISPAATPGKPHSTMLMKTFSLPPHQDVVFAQDGFHLSLREPHRRLYDGDMVTLKFRFSDGSELTLFAPVRRVAPNS